MARHTIGDLEQMRSLPLEAKIKMAQARIRAWYEHYDGDVYVSFSGGKDSTVLKHLVEGMYPDVPSVFVDTGLEWPEVRTFVHRQKNVEIVRPKMKFYEVVDKYGYPVISKEQAQFLHEARTTKSQKLLDLRLHGRNGTGYGRISYKWQFLIDAPFNISHRCCDKLKKDPSKRYEKETGRRPYVGTMTEESLLRTQIWLRDGCNAFEATRPVSRPLSVWTEQDILQYLVDNKLEIARVYGDIVKDELGLWHTTGQDRTGCMFCMFGVQSEPHPNKFEKMKETHPKQYDYCMNKLGMDEVLNYIGVKH